MMSRKAIEIMNETIMSSDNMYAFDDIAEEDFQQLSEEAQQKLNSVLGNHDSINNTNEMFYRIDENGNAQIFNNDGSVATQIDANVYVVGSDGSKSVRYEHPEGIILTIGDAEKIGVHRE